MINGTIAGPFRALGKSSNIPAQQHNNPNRNPELPYGGTPEGTYAVSGIGDEIVRKIDMVRWLSGRKRRFAKRKSASRTSSIFLVNPSLSSTSEIDRVGWRWLSRRCFVASQGQSWGQFDHATCPCPLRGIDLPNQRSI